MSATERAQAWTEFMATECCICHGAKPAKNGFCRGCYYSLPKAMKQALWQRFGEGYEEAHAAARQWLQEKRAEIFPSYRAGKAAS
jgi:hypothetical protein